jgi:hypothetical protein
MALRMSLFLIAFYGSGVALAGQTPGSTPSVQGTNPPMVAKSTPPPSGTLQPSLEILKQAIGTVKVEKWKASPAIRSEAESNAASIQRDLESTLPPLVAAADAAPDSPAKVLPVFRNVDALYDVMLRLVAAGRLAAPNDQMSALDQALSKLSDGRRALGDQLQGTADAQEKQVIRLQAALKAVPPPQPQPAPVVCPSPAPKKKAKAATKPKPAATSSQNSSTPATQ